MNNIPVLLHDHDEYIPAETFLTGIEIYKKIIPKLASVWLQICSSVHCVYWFCKIYFILWHFTFFICWGLLVSWIRILLAYNWFQNKYRHDLTFDCGNFLKFAERLVISSITKWFIDLPQQKFDFVYLRTRRISNDILCISAPKTEIKFIWIQLRINESWHSIGEHPQISILINLEKRQQNSEWIQPPITLKKIESTYIQVTRINHRLIVTRQLMEVLRCVACLWIPTSDSIKMNLRVENYTWVSIKSMHSWLCEWSSATQKLNKGKKILVHYSINFFELLKITWKSVPWLDRPAICSFCNTRVDTANSETLNTKQKRLFSTSKLPRFEWEQIKTWPLDESKLFDSHRAVYYRV